MIASPSEHLPSTQDIVRGNLTPYLLMNPENILLKNFFDVQIPHPEPIFWCNKLDLFLERPKSPLKSSYNIIPHPHLPVPIE